MAKKSQVQKFRETARKIEADESADNFDATLKRVGSVKAKHPAKLGRSDGKKQKARSGQH